MIFLAVVNGQPKEMGLVQAIQHFVDHRIDVVRRRTAYLLMKAHEREHVLEGYQVALDRVDDVIRIIRGSENRADARTNLVEYFTGKTVTRIGRQVRQDGVAEGRCAFAAHEAVRCGPGRRHPRTAIAPADAPVDRRNPERTGRGSRAHRRVRIDPGQREEAARRDRQGTGRDQEEVRRRAPHPDSGRSRRDQPGRPDRRRAGCGDGQPLRLPEAHADLDLSPATPRRHRAQRHEHARGGFRRASVRRLHARLHPGLHQHRTRVLAEGVRDSGAERRGQGQSHRQPGGAATGRERARLAHHSRSGRREPLRLLCHAQRHREEDAAEGLQQRPLDRHQCHPDRERRRTGRRQLHRRQSDHLPGDARRQGDSLRRRKRAPHGTPALTVCAAWTWAGATTSSAWR